MKLSDGEKLILIMLCEIHEKLKVENGIDSKLVQEAVYGGHYWGLEWKFPGVFHKHEDNEEQVSEAVDVMDMWSFLEDAFANLSPEEKRRVEKEAQVFREVTFHGWDGNGEAIYIGIARFLTEQLDRFREFKGRDLNSHMPSRETYKRMMVVFEPMRRNLASRAKPRLDVDELVQILNAAVHPENRLR